MLVIDVARGTVEGVGGGRASTVLTVRDTFIFDLPNDFPLTIGFDIKFDFFSLLVRLMQRLLHRAPIILLVYQRDASQVVAEGLRMS